MEILSGEPTGSAAPTCSRARSSRVDTSSQIEFPCTHPHCDRVFKSKIGMSVHQQKVHKDWYDEKTVKAPVKARWNSEEDALLARREAHLTLENVRFINQALLEFFPERTLESIKSHRKQAQYRKLVLEKIAEIKSGNTQETEQSSPRNRNHENDIAFINHIKHAPRPDNEQFQSARLYKICSSLENITKEAALEELALYLADVFPKRPNTLAKTRGNEEAKMRTKRQERRVLYARTQNLWKRSPGKCLRTILKNSQAEQQPSKELMVPFWKGVMTSHSDTVPEREESRNVETSLWVPIEIGEVKKAFPANNTSPGPDGLTAQNLKSVPPAILMRILNIFMWCENIPEYLHESRTTLIPKKPEAEQPADFRPITVSSVLVRLYHKILANRMMKTIKIDTKQRAFRESDGCAENIFLLDITLRYHHKYHRPLFLASMDIAKAFDSVSHETIVQTLQIMGVPPPMIKYVHETYKRSTTTLSCGGWQSEKIHPTRGVKQGDPLSPMIFNMVMDRLWSRLPKEVGISFGGTPINGAAFADDLILMASTTMGLQSLLDVAVKYFMACGLDINVSKSMTVTLRPVPHDKKTVVDPKTLFTIGGRNLPAMKRTSEWTYLGIPFTPEGKSAGSPIDKLRISLERLSKAPLKPQQRLFGLRTIVIPGFYHVLSMSSIKIGTLNKFDKTVRTAVRKWTCLPHDVPNAYIHAPIVEGGLGVPSLRWEAPRQLLHRLKALPFSAEARTTAPGMFVLGEIEKAENRLRDRGHELFTVKNIRQRWAELLHASVDGGALKASAGTHGQHDWIGEGTRFLSGKDFLNLCRMRINALPTRSRTSRGRLSDRRCRGGCLAAETLNHIQQNCHRTHEARIRRHNAVSKYIVKALERAGYSVEEEPRIPTTEGLRKPDIVAKLGKTTVIIDTQVVSEQTDLDKAHKKKKDYYGKNNSLVEYIKKKNQAEHLLSLSTTISCRGVWSPESAKQLLGLGIIRKKDLKIISTRAMIGGLYAFWMFNATTSMAWNKTGIG